MSVSAHPSWRTVVLSPHFDDAALSLGGLLPLLPGPTAIVTVYGGAPPHDAPTSWWDSACGFSSAAEAFHCRRAEDAAACDLLGAEQVLLDHPDGPYADSAELPGLDALLENLAPDVRVLVPLGTNQPDHAKVRHRALKVLAGLRAPLPWVYADLPYTGHLPEWGTDEADAALAANSTYGPAYRELLDGHRTTVRHGLRLDDDQWARKRAAVLCHGSQHALLAGDHGGFLARTGPLSAELIWSLEPGTPADAGS